MIVVCFVLHMIKYWRMEEIHLNTNSIKLECDKHFGCTEILNKEKKIESIINIFLNTDPSFRYNLKISPVLFLFRCH
ncbi:hypothetical protein BpHYR1_025373 [Brachionus plicatilis]|uniref:Uncharacterized protein n=1 Tax=Brachionus plicatilis TaxID=10195 RepID=A0A3M7PTY1_BRAPC|nr:hypothetical protein BpHYR1_025373 [Brachionus plicatilis]